MERDDETCGSLRSQSLISRKKRRPSLVIPTSGRDLQFPPLSSSSASRYTFRPGIGNGVLRDPQFVSAEPLSTIDNVWLIYK